MVFDIVTILDIENMRGALKKAYLAIPTVILLTISSKMIWQASGLRFNGRSEGVVGTGFPAIIQMTDYRQNDENKNLDNVLRSDPTTRRRSKRDENGKLIVNVTTLSDEGHKEAVVHWSGRTSQVMFLLTRTSNENGTVVSSILYRSDDFGSSFQNIQKSFPNENVLIQYFYMCPSNKDTLMFVDLNSSTIYVTTDEGKSFKPHAVSFAPSVLVFNPSDYHLVLAYSAEDRSLYVSMDLAESWKLVHEMVDPKLFWAIPGYDSDPSTIHMECEDPATGKFAYHAIRRPYTSSDMTTDSNLGYIDIGSLLVINEYIFVQKTTSYSSHLYVSHARGPFKRAYFPNNAHPLDFSIVAADEGQVFIAASNRGGSITLYLSDPTGQFYVKSLDHIVAFTSSDTFLTDLYEVRGLPGTYIVNQHGGESLRSRTLITFDQGGTWRLIPAPKLDHNGSPTNCVLPQCSLYLHLQIDPLLYAIPAPLSEDNAPGLILAHGVIGENKETVFVMSQNGGQEWTVMMNGTYQTSIIDLGGAIVAVPANAGESNSTRILYSCTEGKKWETYSVGSQNMTVDGLLNEPEITSLVTSIYGHTSGKKSGWMIVKLNFSQILSRPCNQSDYVLWNATSGASDRSCLLGQRFSYERRKAENECYNGEDYSRVVTVDYCPCQREDFECDYGYELKDSDCVVASWFNADTPVYDCEVGANIKNSTGYRKVAADKCIDSDATAKFNPVPAVCPVVRPRDLSVEVVGGDIIAINREITFQLMQEEGSHNITVYEWNFGDGTVIRNVGFKIAEKQTHTFKKTGFYTVTVKATNNRGSAQAAVKVWVQDRLSGLILTISHAVQMKKPASFQLVPILLHANKWTTASIDELDNVHFLWLFGDEKSNSEKKGRLTWSSQMVYSYDEPGNYTIWVEAFTGIGSVFRTVTLPVYGTLISVQLTMNGLKLPFGIVDSIFDDTVAQTIHKVLVFELSVESSRLDVEFNQMMAPSAIVSILPEQQMITVDSSIDVILNKLLALVANKSIQFSLPDESFGAHQIITVVKATVLTDQNGDGSLNVVGIAVGVPIIVLIVASCFFVIIYYKKKLRRTQRYSVLHSRYRDDTSGNVGTSLLEDTDDDDPLIDSTGIGQSSSQQRLALSDDDGDDDPLCARIMMSTTDARGQEYVSC